MSETQTLTINIAAAGMAKANSKQFAARVASVKGLGAATFDPDTKTWTVDANPAGPLYASSMRHLVSIGATITEV